jgi:hypothetical protein
MRKIEEDGSLLSHGFPWVSHPGKNRSTSLEALPGQLPVQQDGLQFQGREVTLIGTSGTVGCTTGDVGCGVAARGAVVAVS